ncbi:hypothetical protein GCM10027355_06530 [Haloplanus salinarum]
MLTWGMTDQASGQSGGSWPQFGFNAANDGYAPENAGPVANVTERWQFETGGSVEHQPSVVDGTVYVGSGRSGGGVYALDAASGEERWRFETGDAVVASPSVAGDTVYVGCVNSNLYALDAESGEERWRFATVGEVSSPPTVAEDTVYVGSGGAGGGVVHALDAASGDERWRAEMGVSSITAPAAVDDTVYVAVPAATSVSALDAGSGEERWRFDAGAAVFSAPAVADGTVYVGSRDNVVHALDAGSGEERWRFAARDTVRATPAVADGTVYVGSRDNTVYALDAGSGEERWRFETGSSVNSSPSVAGDTVYVGSADVTYALDADSGGEQWAVQSPASVVSSPAVVGGTVYVGSGGVYAFAGDTATPEATTTAPSGSGGDAGGSGADDGSDLPLVPLAGVGAAGVGAGGLWYWKRNGEGAATPGGSAPGTDPGSAGGPTTDSRGTGGGSRAGAPDRIPQAPEVSVEYDALTDEEPLGGGGNADVAKATLPTPDGDVILAIKRPRMQGTLHTDAVDRLMEEAETWDKIDDHDHVVGVVDYGASPVPWIAMEYMDAGHLADRAGDLPFDQAVWSAVRIVEGVHHAHRRGVAHLDLKPENVLFRSVEDAWDVPKVADWGLSKHLLDHSKSVEGLSPQYAAPEQFDEQYGNPDDITDIYQLGTVLYELFTGRPPFEGRPSKAMRRVLDEEPTPPSDVADVPQALDRVLLTALAKEKSERYETVLYLRDALRELGE